MFVVTNRELKNPKRYPGLDLFGSRPNPKGPNELRIVEITKQGDGYLAEPVPDELTLREARMLKRTFRLDINERQVRHGSLRVACQLMQQATQQQRHLLVYVHGYNNDMSDVVKTAEDIEQLYGVIVLPFSWPANGGGLVSGTTAYLNDKQDARASMDALNRFLDKLHFFHLKLTEARKNDLWTQADGEHRENPSAAQERFAELLHDDCKVNLSMLCHSMGNYLLKYALRPTQAASKQLIFDNISLVAADANNAEHQPWVEQLQTRNRLFIMINENDFALQWSRRKPGDEQGPRLGHHLKNLTARNARYIDVTQAAAVDNAHNYFTGKPVQRNAALKTLFSLALEGGRADHGLAYAADINCYRL
ncbi:MAG: alpha/beta hydrolase [Chromatiaceae bacterium]|nr:alpha/beta hydrolase [Chromatiaceae bacterium]MCF7993371.1 alpha/beta hydrolase [Chromatiaceae bacterium]MCF8017230.1 alpha/beta hydrolase [Chromatiaceae bacterium]